MKKFAILMALLLVQLQITAVAAATYNKQPAQAQAQATKPVSNKTTQVYKQDGSDYLLKYNIDDLEAAPWLNNGKRVYDNNESKK